MHLQTHTHRGNKNPAGNRQLNSYPKKPTSRSLGPGNKLPKTARVTYGCNYSVRRTMALHWPESPGQSKMSEPLRAAGERPRWPVRPRKAKRVTAKGEGNRH